MKIAVIRITGCVGSRIAAELLHRGHAVTGIARDTSKTASREGLSLKRGDANDVAVPAPIRRRSVDDGGISTVLLAVAIIQ